MAVVGKIFAHLTQSEGSVHWILDDASDDIVNENIKQWNFSCFFIIQTLGDAKINIFFVFRNSTRSDDGNNIAKERW